MINKVYFICTIQIICLPDDSHSKYRKEFVYKLLLNNSHPLHWLLHLLQQHTPVYVLASKIDIHKIFLPPNLLRTLRTNDKVLTELKINFGMQRPLFQNFVLELSP